MTSNDVMPFVIGSGRSGTTLLATMLDTHPELALAHEAHFIADIARRHPGLTRPGHFDRSKFIEELSSNSNFRRLGVSLATVRDLVADSDSYAAAVRAVMANWAEGRGKRLYGDKTPGYVNQLDLLAGLFPEARFIHIIRDGRDVALAYLDRPEWGPRSVGEAALYWRSRVRRGRRAGRRLGPARYLEVSYEVLIGQPEQVLNQVCSFLGLDLHLEMLDHQKKAGDVASSSGNAGAFGSLSLPLTPGLRDWRLQMAPSDVSLFEALAGDVLAEHNYELAGNSGVVTHLRRISAIAGWQMRRFTARLRSFRKKSLKVPVKPGEVSP